MKMLCRKIGKYGFCMKNGQPRNGTARMRISKPLEDPECIASSILSRIAEVILDPKQLVVLGKPVGAAHRTCLDLAGLESDYEVSDEAVLSLAGAVGYDSRVAVALCKVDGFECSSPPSHPLPFHPRWR